MIRFGYINCRASCLFLRQQSHATLQSSTSVRRVHSLPNWSKWQSYPKGFEKFFKKPGNKKNGESFESKTNKDGKNTGSGGKKPEMPENNNTSRTLWILAGAGLLTALLLEDNIKNGRYEIFFFFFVTSHYDAVAVKSAGMTFKSNFWKVGKSIELLLRIRTLQGIDDFNLLNHIIHIGARVVMRSAQANVTEGKEGEANSENFGWPNDGKTPAGKDENHDVPPAKVSRYPSIGSPSNYTAPYFFNIG